MKKSEQSLLLVSYLLLLVFFVFLLIVPSSDTTSDSDQTKFYILFLFVLGITAIGTISGTVSKWFVLFFPLFFQLNKTIVFLGDFITLPAIIDEKIKMLGVVIFTVFLILFDFKKMIAAFRFKPVLFYNLFILSGLFTLVWAININVSIAYIPKIVLLPITYFVFLRLFEFDERNIFYLSWGLIFTSLLSIIFIWPDYFGIKWFSFLLTEGGTGGYHDPNSVRAGGLVSRTAIALVLATTIPYIYNFGIYYYPKYKIWIHGTVVILLMSLFLTLSRMDVAATLMGTSLVLWYMIIEKKVKLNIAFIFFGLIVFGLLAYYIITANGNSVEDAITRDTWEGRIEQFGAGFANFDYSYGFGVGMNNYLVSYISVEVLGSNAWNFRSGNTLHSDYIRILGEFGLAGFIFFTSFYIAAFKTNTKIKAVQPLVRGAKITIGVLALCGLSEPALNLDGSIVICGIYLAIIAYYQNKTQSDVFFEVDQKNI